MKSIKKKSIKNLSKRSIKKLSKKNKYKLPKLIFNYDNTEDCINSQKIEYLLNPKEFYNLLPKRLVLKKEITKTNKLKELDYEIYQKLNRKVIVDTFNYMYFHIRMGIFVYIKNNKLYYFIPFVNKDYKNNFSSYLKLKNNMSLNEYYNYKQKYLKKKDSLEKNINKWSANNCLIGNWVENEVGDMGWYELYDMIQIVCNTRKVNDCIFFINRRDHPVLTPNKMEPYFHIFNNLSTPLKQHSYDKYVPILSFSKNDNFADILIPNYGDWRNITKFLYPSTCKDMEKDNINNNWNTKNPKAVFRGSATGCGITPETNQRIKVALISKNVNKKNKKIIDAGLVGNNLRDKKFKDKKVDFYHYKNFNLPRANYISMNIQSNYKYIIHIDGHVSAYRLGKELSLGSTILKVDSLFDYKLWFSGYLKENIHYIPIKKDLSNLIQTIKWCKQNDNKCKQIANNSMKLYNKIMNIEFVLNYFTNVINSISLNYII